MSRLYWNTVTPEMRVLMRGFAQNALSKEFYLAGGTALALQLGHRLSIDLDFFSPTQADISVLIEPLRHVLKDFSPVLADSTWGNLVFLANNVRVGFYGYGYELLEPFAQAEGISLASITDIGLMKLDALLSRASRKDFHDLYTICQRIPLQELLALGKRKYPSMRDFEAQVTRHLLMFERAEQETPVPLIEQVTWETVKDWFQTQAKTIGSSWLD